MAWTTLIGLLIGFGAMLLSTTLEGGSPAGLLNTPAAVMVFGGTIGCALISFPPHITLGLPKMIMRIFQQKLPDANKTINLLVDMADKARRQGLLSLEEEGAKLNDPFLKMGLQLVVDGIAPETVRQLLEIDTEQMAERHAASYQMLTALGGYAPTMGIIGTVMGLVSVLGKLGNDPAGLGESIASAFIATLYGVATANLLWLPLGNKLKAANEEEVLLRTIMSEGILAIGAGDNPRVVRTKLESFLPPRARGKGEAAAAGGGAGVPAEAGNG
jgi:chemotaxis protein MotA